MPPTILPPSCERAQLLAEALADPARRRALADELGATLRRHVLDAHWPATADRECGGFLTDLDQRWRPCGPQRKSLEFQARQTWVFARAARQYPGRGYEDAARQGFAFLRDRMWDSIHGGFFTLVDRHGRPLEQGRKHPHGHAYAIEACVAMAPLVGETESRGWAERALQWLDTRAWDHEHGGYWGYFERDGTRIAPDRATGRDHYDWIGTPNGFKDINVTGDTTAALSTLLAQGWGSSVAVKLRALARLYLDRLITEFGLMSYLYTREWTPLPDIARAGNPLQSVATLCEVARVLNAWDGVIPACERVTRACRDFFAHPEGGVMFARSFTPAIQPGCQVSVPTRAWWVQTEATKASLLLALLAPADPSHREAFARQWAFVERALLDERFGGMYESAEEGARARRPLTGRFGRTRKTHLWKDATHEAHFLMDAVEWLRNGAPAPRASMS